MTGFQVAKGGRTVARAELKQTATANADAAFVSI
jgi:hypothetical protein